MEDYFFNSVVRGHHVFKAVWTPYTGETLSVHEECDNEHDSFAVSVKNGSIIVGHVPREVSRIFTFL